jgi:hypothetical protein
LDGSTLRCPEMRLHFDKRFDWFVGGVRYAPRNEERMNNLQRLSLAILLTAIMLAY